MLRGRNMTKSTTNFILSTDMRGRTPPRIPSTTQSPVLPQVTDCRLTNYTACNHCLSDFHAQTPHSWWAAFTCWAMAINTAWNVNDTQSRSLQDAQKISASIKGCYSNFLGLIKLQHCLEHLNPRPRREGIIAFLVCSCDEKKWRGFPLGRLLKSSPSFFRIFMVEAFGWRRGPQEKAGWPSGVHLNRRP